MLSYCADQHPELIMPWIPAMVKKMKEPGVHDAVKRNVLRVLSTVEIPSPILGSVISVCFDELSSADSPVAVRVHAMSVLANASKGEPDIKRELKATIEQMLPYGGPALRARARMVLKQISREG